MSRAKTAARIPFDDACITARGTPSGLVPGNRSTDTANRLGRKSGRGSGAWSRHRALTEVLAKAFLAFPILGSPRPQRGRPPPNMVTAIVDTSPYPNAHGRARIPDQNETSSMVPAFLGHRTARPVKANALATHGLSARGPPSRLLSLPLICKGQSDWTHLSPYCCRPRTDQDRIASRATCRINASLTL